MNEKVPYGPQIIDILDHEKLYEEADRIPHPHVIDLHGVTIISGNHDVHGNVHIVIPCTGLGVVLSSHQLPISSQSSV